MIYNKKKQPYNILERFRITEENGTKEYCRVKFVMTGNEQVLPHEVVWRGDFEDKVEPLVKDPVVESPITKIEKASEQIALKATKEDLDKLSGRVEKAESSITVQAGQIATKVTKTEYEPVAIATSPQGEEIKVYSLKSFAEEHDLDVEAVQAVLDGEQKTHKKWRFVKA